MTTRHRSRQATRPARRAVPITRDEYEQLVDCRCSLLTGTHQALHCAQIRESRGGAR